MGTAYQIVKHNRVLRFKSLKRKQDQWKKIERSDIEKIHKINARKIDHLVNGDGIAGLLSEKLGSLP